MFQNHSRLLSLELDESLLEPLFFQLSQQLGWGTSAFISTLALKSFKNDSTVTSILLKKSLG